MHTNVASLPTGTVTFFIDSANLGISEKKKNITMMFVLFYTNTFILFLRLYVLKYVFCLIIIHVYSDILKTYK